MKKKITVIGLFYYVISQKLYTFIYLFSCFVLSLSFSPILLFLSLCLLCVSLQAGESSGLFKKTISKLSTEYRLQFVWPNVRRIKGIEAGDAADYPRKSISMGALKASQQQQQQQQQLHLRQHPQPAMPTVHKKRTTNQKEGATILNCR